MKWLIAKNNSPWGVKKDGQGNQFYTHIIDFDSEALRDEYLNKEVFGGDYKTLVQAQLDKGNHPRTANKVVFRVDNSKEYTEETLDTLLNKDFAVSFDVKTKEYSFWAIEGITEGSTSTIIKYTATRDWLFERGIRNMFKDNDVVIDRAHINDVKDGLWNISQESENSIVEPIEQFSEENFMNTTKRDISVIDYRSVYQGVDYEDFEAELKKGWTAYTFQPTRAQNGNIFQLVISSIYGEDWHLFETMYESEIIDAKTNSFLKFTSNRDIVPIVVFLIPNSDKIVIEPIAPITGSVITNSRFKTIFNGSPQLIKISPLPYTPLNVDSINTITYDATEYRIQMKTKFSGEISSSQYKEQEIPILSNSLKYHAFLKHVVDNFDIETTPSVVNTADYDVDFNKPFILNNIAKLHKYPYKQIYLKSITGARMNLYQQIVKNSFSWQLTFTYAPDVWHQLIKIKDIDDPQGQYNNDFQYGLRLDDVAPFTMPQENSAWLEYLNQNKNQVNQQLRRMWQNVGFGAVETAIGMTTGGGLGVVLGAVGGSQQILNSVNDIFQQRAMLSDLHRNPSQITGNGGDVMGVLPSTTMKPIEFTDELWPELKASVGQFFHMYGSKLNSRFRRFNDYLNTKYHFNFIQSQSMFENYREDVPMTNETRQIIDKSLENGITIWHVRDLLTFKGIKNYNVNNVDYNNSEAVKLPLKK